MHKVVIPRAGGVSTTPRLVGSIIAVSGILDHPPQCAIAHKAGDDSFEVEKGRGALRSLAVIASVAKQSMPRHKERMDCFVALAMTNGWSVP
jgi:hypothetical protein